LKKRRAFLLATDDWRLAIFEIVDWRLLIAGVGYRHSPTGGSAASEREV
jgi:hypothetical protein